MRQIIKLASVTKVISKAASGKADRYDFENLTTKKDVHHRDIELGKEFQDEALDSTQHKVCLFSKTCSLFNKSSQL